MNVAEEAVAEELLPYKEWFTSVVPEQDHKTAIPLQRRLILLPRQRIEVQARRILLQNRRILLQRRRTLLPTG